MSDELKEEMKDAHKTFQAKFENAYAASRWVEKEKRQKQDDPPARKPAEEPKVDKRAEKQK
eukprot:4318446-Karenia_brevis.AAC.1